MLGCIGVAMGFYTYEVVNEYARDASRYAMVHGNGCSIPRGTTSCSIGHRTSAANSALRTYLNNEIYPGINGNNLTVTTIYVPGPGATSCNATACNGGGDQVTVTVAIPLPLQHSLHPLEPHQHERHFHHGHLPVAAIPFAP